MNELEEMGYYIMPKKEFDELDKTGSIKDIFGKEKWERDFDPTCLDYLEIDVKNITIDEDGKSDIIYEDKNVNLSYLEWFETKNWTLGMEWYKKNYAHIPLMEHLAYSFVKRDLTGKIKLEKYELNEIKKEAKKKEQKRLAAEKEREKQIRLIKDMKAKLKNSQRYRKSI